MKKILSVEGLYKKYAKTLKHNMVYGVVDVWQSLWGETLEVDKLRKQEFWALQNITFEVEEGDFLTIVGSNGSGKTTLLRILAGIYPFEMGRVEWHHQPKITSLFAMRSGLHPLFSGRENIYLKGAMMGMTKADIDAKMDFILQLSGLEKHLDMPLGHYSSGMQSKLAFSVAMAIDTNILLIDEGFAFSDLTFKMQAFEYLRIFVQQPQKAIIMATHQLGKVYRLANRMILLDNGKIITDTPNLQKGMQQYLDLSKKKNTIHSQNITLDNWFLNKK